MARSQDVSHPGAARRHVAARTQVALSVLVGGLVAAAAGALASPGFCALAGWDATTLVYMGLVWRTIWRRDAERTARLAEQADPTRAAADLLVLSASVASLVAIGMTFQVSDTHLETDELRRTALRHALLSYLFGTGILATAINLVASLSR